MRVGDVVTSVDPRDNRGERLVVMELGVATRTGLCARVRPSGSTHMRYRFEHYLRPAGERLSATRLQLSCSETSTIVRALATDGAPASTGVLRELNRQGVALPVWVQERMYEAAWKAADVLDGAR